MNSRRLGMPALHCVLSARKVAEDDTIAALRLLCGCGADVNQGNGIGRTALHFAVEKNLECVKVLMEYGADPTVEDEDGKSPMYFASGEALNIMREYAPDKTGNTKPGSGSDLSDVLSFKHFSGGQSSVFLRNLKTKGYNHQGGKMLDSGNYVEEWSNGRCVVSISTTNDDRIGFLSFIRENGEEEVLVDPS